MNGARAAVAMLTFLLVAAPAPATAQRSTGDRACRVDTTAEWYMNQRAFYVDPTEAWSDDSLRQALLKAAGYDPKSIFAAELGWRLGATPTLASDNPALALLREMAQRRQWPTRALVGKAGVHAAWLIAQQDSALAVAAMRRMMEAGPGESSPAEVAVLDDAQRVRVGRGQIHGTQFTKSPTGVAVVGRIEDSVHVDMRREGAWLPPIVVSACLAAQAAR